MGPQGLGSLVEAVCVGQGSASREQSVGFVGRGKAGVWWLRLRDMHHTHLSRSTSASSTRKSLFCTSLWIFWISSSSLCFCSLVFSSSGKKKASIKKPLRLNPLKHWSLTSWVGILAPPVQALCELEEATWPLQVSVSSSAKYTQ